MSLNAKSVPLPCFSLMLVSLVLGLVFLNCVHQPLLADPDIGWHLRDAQLLLDHHSFLRQDPYTFSLRDHSWMNPEWLAEIFFYEGWRCFGVRGLEAVSILLIELMAAGVSFLAWQRTRSMRCGALACAIWIIFSSVSIAPRPQLCGWLCLILELAVLEHFRVGTAGKRHYLWLLPALFALWINLHGSWPVGFALLAVFIASGMKTFERGLLQASSWSPSQRKGLIMIGLVSASAVFLNPYGWHLVVYPFVIAGKHPLTLSAVQEWQSLDMHAVRGRLVLIIVATLVGARIWRPRPLRLYDAVSILLAIFAGFSYSRFLLFTGIIVCPLLAEEAADLLGHDNPSVDKPWLNAGIIALVLAFALNNFPSAQQLELQSKMGYPNLAVAYLREHPPAGPMLNDFNWGGFLIWNDPSLPIFIDTRADLFEESGLLKSYLDVVNLQSPLEGFEHQRFQYVFFPRHAALLAALTRSPDWIVEYQDDTAVLLRRISLRHLVRSMNLQVRQTEPKMQVLRPQRIPAS